MNIYEPYDMDMRIIDDLGADACFCFYFPL
jgi:hypothetical protein